MSLWGSQLGHNISSCYKKARPLQAVYMQVVLEYKSKQKETKSKAGKCFSSVVLLQVPALRDSPDFSQYQTVSLEV